MKVQLLRNRDPEEREDSRADYSPRLLRGCHKGRRLADLSIEELLLLWQEYRNSLYLRDRHAFEEELTRRRKRKS